MKATFLFLNFLFVSLFCFSQLEETTSKIDTSIHKPKYDHRAVKSIGGGYGIALGRMIASGSWNVFVDFGKWGLEYYQSAFLKNLDYTPYVNGLSDKYTPGGAARNIGAFFKSEGGFYYGTGAQFVKQISIVNERFGNDYIPKVIDETIVRPYFTLGYSCKVNDAVVMRFGSVISKIPIVQGGIGIKFQ